MVYINENGGVRVGVRITAQQLETATYLLDSYGGAAAAYSLRKLSNSYSGSAIRVRRSGDNVEGNIGFDAGGNLDTNSLLDFVGYSNLFTAPNNLADVGWGANGITKTANLPDGPTGATSSNKMTEMATNVQHFLSYSIITGTIDTHNVSAYLKKGTGSAAPDRIAISVGNATYGMWAIFNLTTGLIETQVPGTATSFQVVMTNAGNGWWRCSVGGDLNYTTSQNIRTSVQFCNNSVSYNPFTTSYIGNVNADVLVANLQWIREAGLQRYGVAGGGNGFVTTWYDQSSSYDAVQTTSTKQPQIVSGGVLLTQNNKPTIKFDGLDDFFVTGTYSFTSTDKLYGAYVSTTEWANANSMVVGQYRQTNTQAVYILGYANTANTWVTTRNSAGTIAYSYLHGSYAINTQYLAETQLDLLNTKSVLKTKTWRNNVSEVMTTNGSTTTALPNISMPISIGADVIGATWRFKGNIQEIVLYYNADKTSERASIATNINNYYNIYTPTPAPNLTTGLFGIWNGNGNTNDTYGTLNGSATGGLTYSVGKNGSAFTFNNSSATMVSFPINSWTTGDNFSFSLWFNVTSLTSASQALISNYGYTNSSMSYYGWGLRVSTGGLTLQRFTGATEEFSSGTVTANQWHHVVVTRNGSVTKVYLNGDLVGGRYSTAATVYSNTVPRIGLRMDTDTTNAVWPMTNGSKIDEVYLWTRAITDDEAKLLYNSGNGQYYPF